MGTYSDDDYGDNTNLRLDPYAMEYEDLFDEEKSQGSMFSKSYAKALAVVEAENSQQGHSYQRHDKDDLEANILEFPDTNIIPKKSPENDALIDFRIDDPDKSITSGLSSKNKLTRMSPLTMYTLNIQEEQNKKNAQSQARRNTSEEQLDRRQFFSSLKDTTVNVNNCYVSELTMMDFNDGSKSFGEDEYRLGDLPAILSGRKFEDQGNNNLVRSESDRTEKTNNTISNKTSKDSIKSNEKALLETWPGSSPSESHFQGWPSEDDDNYDEDEDKIDDGNGNEFLGWQDKEKNDTRDEESNPPNFNSATNDPIHNQNPSPQTSSFIPLKTIPSSKPTILTSSQSAHAQTPIPIKRDNYSFETNNSVQKPELSPLVLGSALKGKDSQKVAPKRQVSFRGIDNISTFIPDSTNDRPFYFTPIENLQNISIVPNSNNSANDEKLDQHLDHNFIIDNSMKGNGNNLKQSDAWLRNNDVDNSMNSSFITPAENTSSLHLNNLTSTQVVDTAKEENNMTYSISSSSKSLYRSISSDTSKNLLGLGILSECGEAEELQEIENMDEVQGFQFLPVPSTNPPSNNTEFPETLDAIDNVNNDQNLMALLEDDSIDEEYAFESMRDIEPTHSVPSDSSKLLEKESVSQTLSYDKEEFSQVPSSDEYSNPLLTIPLASSETSKESQDLLEENSEASKGKSEISGIGINHTDLSKGLDDKQEIDVIESTTSTNYADSKGSHNDVDLEVESSQNYPIQIQDKSDVEDVYYVASPEVNEALQVSTDDISSKEIEESNEGKEATDTIFGSINLEPQNEMANFGSSESHEVKVTEVMANVEEANLDETSKSQSSVSTDVQETLGLKTSEIEQSTSNILERKTYFIEPISESIGTLNDLHTHLSDESDITEVYLQENTIVVESKSNEIKSDGISSVVDILDMKNENTSYESKEIEIDETSEIESKSNEVKSDGISSVVDVLDMKNEKNTSYESNEINIDDTSDELKRLIGSFNASNSDLSTLTDIRSFSKISDKEDKINTTVNAHSDNAKITNDILDVSSITKQAKKEVDKTPLSLENSDIEKCFDKDDSDNQLHALISSFNMEAAASSNTSAAESISQEFKGELSSPKDEQDDFTSKINEWNQMTEMSIRRLDKTETEQTDFESKINNWNQMTEMSIRQLDIKQETDEMDVKGMGGNQIETDEESRLSPNKHLSTNLNGNKDGNDKKNESEDTNNSKDEVSKESLSELSKEKVKIPQHSLLQEAVSTSDHLLTNESKNIGNEDFEEKPSSLLINAEKKDDHQVKITIAQTALGVAKVNGPSRTKMSRMESVKEVPDLESMSSSGLDEHDSASKNENDDTPSIPLLPDNKQTQDSKSDSGNNTTSQNSDVVENSAVPILPDKDSNEGNQTETEELLSNVPEKKEQLSRSKICVILIMIVVVAAIGVSIPLILASKDPIEEVVDGNNKKINPTNPPSKETEGDIQKKSNEIESNETETHKNNTPSNHSDTESDIQKNSNEIESNETETHKNNAPSNHSDLSEIFSSPPSASPSPSVFFYPSVSPSVSQQPSSDPALVTQAQIEQTRASGIQSISRDNNFPEIPTSEGISLPSISLNIPPTIAHPPTAISTTNKDHISLFKHRDHKIPEQI